ncbi:phage major tail tube protein [Methylobacterium sp. WCS2018Hpa-22]|uniref:phage major tail tube protein n=1 Tax=Methylobacterium sp. WCS2018Hpa-22 TaxID=3073633 RepID=UPI00288BB246|nr:phage major tail tube protein [Methylobacterium sp. WCS2018Hpa-22]
MLPRHLRAFNAFVNGQGWAGRVEEVELPAVKVKREEFRGGGMNAPKQLDMGTEALEAKLTFAEYLPEIVRCVALGDTMATRVQLRGAIQRNGEAALPVVVDLIGSFDESEMGTWKEGDNGKHEITMSAGYYKLSIDGQRLIEIDVDNCIRIVGDNDVLESIRSAIGL